MSAASDAAHIGALSSALHNLLHADPVNIAKCRIAHGKLCLALTNACEAYGAGAGLTPGEIDTAIQGGGVPKNPA